MPIKPENKTKYPKDWRDISLRVRIAAGWKCEFCGAEQGKAHPETGSKVILTVAHMDHDPTHCERSNLKALCQKCHLTYDAQHHAESASKTRAAKKQQALDAAGQQELF